MLVGMPCARCGGSPLNRQRSLRQSTSPDLPDGGYSLLAYPDCADRWDGEDFPVYFVARGYEGSEAIFPTTQLDRASEHHRIHGGILFAAMASSFCRDAVAAMGVEPGE